MAPIHATKMMNTARPPPEGRGGMRLASLVSKGVQRAAKGATAMTMSTDDVFDLLTAELHATGVQPSPREFARMRAQLVRLDAQARLIPRMRSHRRENQASTPTRFHLALRLKASHWAVDSRKD
jgi:hypothetical protein